ncbi:hypothetical protein [Steroidobacter sp.]|uniref:hypothetical protein n=1 Tax=Steroidobacter sp. TaxID=1978227 RepID=UPI001A5E49D6|nr:hypothetical protein [Steroidobacter sp.]MBL8267770.1 hypothetical protein [Steroidobacter sp.]
MATLVLLAACSSEPGPEAAAPSQAAAKPTAARPGDETATFAKAVSDGKPGAAVNIRYDFSAKPSVGTPTELDVAFIPSAGVDSLEATLSGMEGITLAGPLQASFNSVESGKAYRHKLSVLPDRTGVFYITASVNTQIAGSMLNRTFSIPFVVGQPVVQQKPAPATDAKGEAIEPMKAEESTQPKNK